MRELNSGLLINMFSLQECTTDTKVEVPKRFNFFARDCRTRKKDRDTAVVVNEEYPDHVVPRDLYNMICEHVTEYVQKLA